jgi:preprotein translocase SecE subunit
MGVQIPPGLPYTLIRYRAWHNWMLEGRRLRAEKTKMEFSIKEKFEVAIQFLREVRTELKKVTWPSRKDTLSGTLIVLVAVIIIAVFLGIVDFGLSGLVKQLLRGAAS